MALDVAVLLSIGRHPASGRPRRAEADAQALEMALRLAGNPRVHAIHAGDPDEPALAEYLGMGLATLTVLRQPSGADVFPALAQHLKSLKPALTIAGSAAETGEASGMLPYLLAQALGAALLPAIAELSLGADRVQALQALARGRRRRLASPLPCIVIADRAGPAPRQSAFAAARRGRILPVDLPPGPPPPRDFREIPARPKPRRLKTMSEGNAAERLRVATEMQAGRGRLMVDPPADLAARAIFDYLRAEGILLPSPQARAELAAT